MAPTSDLNASENFDGPSSQAPETSSPAVETTPSAPSPEPSSTPSTEVKPGEAKETLLDAVLKVVPTTPEEDVLGRSKDADPDAKPETEDQAGKKPDEPEDTTTDEDDEKAAAEAANPATRKKINKLLKQRHELRNEVASLRPTAQIGGELQTFATTNDLSGDDIIMTLNMAAALRRGDYHSFYQAVAPFVRKAQEYLGVVLPEDLNQRVQQGHMTSQAAAEFARTRFDKELADARVQDSQIAQSNSGLQALQADIQRGVTALEGRFAASDPDYKAKAGQVRRMAQALLFEHGGKISSLQEAMDITRAAYAEVNKTFRQLQPAPRATNPVPNGYGTSPAVRREPTTLMEAALQGLAASRRG
jgi:hypothetical protein